MQLTTSQAGRAESAARRPRPRLGEASVRLARRRSATRRVLTIGRGGGAGVRISGKRLPFCCLLQPRRADLSNSVLYPKRSRNGSSFLKSQRERRQRQRKKKRGGGEGDAHKPSSGRKKKKKNHHLSARESGNAEVARSESGPTKSKPINFKS